MTDIEISPGSIANRGSFLLLRDLPGPGVRKSHFAAKWLTFYRHISRKYLIQRTFVNFPLYFPDLSPNPVPVTIEQEFHFNPIIHWIWQNRIQNDNRGYKYSIAKGEPVPGKSAPIKWFNYRSRVGSLIDQTPIQSLSPSLTRFLSQSLHQSVPQHLTTFLTASSAWISFHNTLKREVERFPAVGRLSTPGTAKFEGLYLPTLPTGHPDSPAADKPDLRKMRIAAVLSPLQSLTQTLTQFFSQSLTHTPGAYPIRNLPFQRTDLNGRGDLAPTLTYRTYGVFRAIRDIFALVQVGAKQAVPRPPLFGVFSDRLLAASFTGPFNASTPWKSIRDTWKTATERRVEMARGYPTVSSTGEATWGVSLEGTPRTTTFEKLFLPTLSMGRLDSPAADKPDLRKMGTAAVLSPIQSLTQSLTQFFNQSSSHTLTQPLTTLLNTSFTGPFNTFTPWKSIRDTWKTAIERRVEMARGYPTASSAGEATWGVSPEGTRRTAKFERLFLPAVPTAHLDSPAAYNPDLHKMRIAAVLSPVQSLTRSLTQFFSQSLIHTLTQPLTTLITASFTGPFNTSTPWKSIRDTWKTVIERRVEMARGYPTASSAGEATWSVSPEGTRRTAKFERLFLPAVPTGHLDSPAAYNPDLHKMRIASVLSPVQSLTRSLTQFFSQSLTHSPGAYPIRNLPFQRTDLNGRGNLAPTLTYRTYGVSRAIRDIFALVQVGAKQAVPRPPLFGVFSDRLLTASFTGPFNTSTPWKSIRDTWKTVIERGMKFENRVQGNRIREIDSTDADTNLQVTNRYHHFMFPTFPYVSTLRNLTALSSTASIKPSLKQLLTLSTQAATGTSIHSSASTLTQQFKRLTTPVILHNNWKIAAESTGGTKSALLHIHMKPSPPQKVMSRELKEPGTGIGTTLISGIKSISTSTFTIPGQHREIITQKIPRETLKNRTPAPGKETAGKSPSFPELPGFEKERLEKRYTSVFYLFRAQDSPGLVPTVPTAKNVQTFLQPHLWLSSNSSPGPQGSRETWQRAEAARVINLRSLAEPGYTEPHPVMTHFSRTGDEVTESRIKEIEQTIITDNKKLENQLKDAVKTSRTRYDFPGVSSSQPGIDVTHLTDGVYKLILERVKRERKMLGL